jgi:hypothetical protein
MERLGENVPKLWAPQNYTCIEYFAMKKCGGKIEFRIWSGALIPRAFFPQTFLLLDF